MNNGVAPVTLAALIEAALTNTVRYNQHRLGKGVLSYVRRMCRFKAPDLAADLIEEVAQEAIARLFAAGAAALDGKAPLRLLRHVALDALRKVRADYAPPGQRTRRYKDEPRDRIAASDATRIPDATAIEAATVRAGDHAMIEVDGFASPEADLAKAESEQRIEIRSVLAKLPPSVAAALRLVHVHEHSMAEVAALAGIDRFALRRRIEVACRPIRLAA